MVFTPQKGPKQWFYPQNGGFTLKTGFYPQNGGFTLKTGFSHGRVYPQQGVPTAGCTHSRVYPQWGVPSMGCTSFGHICLIWPYSGNWSQNVTFWGKIHDFDPFWTPFMDPGIHGLASSFPESPVSVVELPVLKMDVKIMHLGTSK